MGARALPRPDLPSIARTGEPEGIRSKVYRVECRKLAAQMSIRVLAIVCLLGPFVFGAILRVQNGSPADTLYGVWVHSSGFAVSLVLLAFAGTWGFPLIAGIVAGDMFSAEDRYGTWKMLLTRACTRRDVFVGKLLAAASFSIGLALLTALSSIAAGVLLVGDQPLLSLNGTLLSTGGSLGRVLLSWLLTIPPTLAFASLGVLLSIATRNGIMGVIGPGLCALAMQLLLLVGSAIWMHMLLIASAMQTWHALFTANPYYGPLLIGLGISVLWSAACLGVGWHLLSGRDFAGTPVSRRPGWITPLYTAVGLAATIALLAIAGNWGPVGVTKWRLRTELVRTFERLTILQQRELGHEVPPGAKLNIALPSCSRRGSAPSGPGDWVCTINVFVPKTAELPFEATPVSYDVSVQYDGCYKAQSPPAFIGEQTMRNARGQTVVNPLYTIYGCFDTL